MPASPLLCLSLLCFFSTPLSWHGTYTTYPGYVKRPSTYDTRVAVPEWVPAGSIRACCLIRPLSTGSVPRCGPAGAEVGLRLPARLGGSGLVMKEIWLGWQSGFRISFGGAEILSPSDDVSSTRYCCLCYLYFSCNRHLHEA